ncbi:MAG: class I SAM-dependent methyltransferase [Sphingobacteriales bacterium]|nr:MAG: class I SAM-dependent methyltransferase [Sphingobacteriales bacterium]
MSIDNQKDYWDRVANEKTFTHPIDLALLQTRLSRDALIVDYGCGYGRIVHELEKQGYSNVMGYDSSVALINRGNTGSDRKNLYHINDPCDLPLDDHSVDCFLLMAVLTCIPSNRAQQSLINLLIRKLKPGGLIFISDYYLGENATPDHGEYSTLHDDPLNYGVFTLPEGATFRHHTREWISMLLKNLSIISEKMIEVKTMNGHKTEAFQILASNAGDNG